MSKDSLLVRSLDTITSNLHSLQHKVAAVDSLHAKVTGMNVQFQSLQTGLETLNRHNSWDVWVRAATVLIALASALIAIWLFRKNREKDFHIKKAEIAGDIYSGIFEFKRLKLLIWRNEIMNDIYITVKSKVKNEEQIKLADRLFWHVTEDNPDNKTKEHEKGLDTVRKELLGKIGQYRFYVSKGEKALLKFHTNAVTLNREIPSLFDAEGLTFEDVMREYWAVVDSVINKERDLLEKQFGAIERIIDDYDRFIKEVELSP